MTQPEIAEGPRTPDEDETFGPEPDDPRAAGSFADAYEVTEFDPANELKEICEANGGSA